MSNARNIAGITTDAVNASGELVPVYACRAWVNFEGTSGTSGDNKTIRGFGNVTSVYESTAGRFRVNFSEPMPDRNYAVAVSCYGQSSIGKNASVCTGSHQTETGDSAFQTGYVDLTVTVDNGGTRLDLDVISVAVFK